MIPLMLFFATREAVVRAFVGTLELPKEVVEKVSAASGSTPVYSKTDYSMSLLPLLFPFAFTKIRTHGQTSSHLSTVPTWFSLFFTFIAAVILLKGDKVARAAAILNANMETSDKKAKSEASDDRETESCLEKVDVS